MEIDRNQPQRKAMTTLVDGFCPRCGCGTVLPLGKRSFLDQKTFWLCAGCGTHLGPLRSPWVTACYVGLGLFSLVAILLGVLLISQYQSLNEREEIRLWFVLGLLLLGLPLGVGVIYLSLHEWSYPRPLRRKTGV
jgi:uncharacterized protein (DUF983 family)